jgi:hypothetical protein
VAGTVGHCVWQIAFPEVQLAWLVVSLDLSTCNTPEQVKQHLPLNIIALFRFMVNCLGEEFHYFAIIY